MEHVLRHHHSSEYSSWKSQFREDFSVDDIKLLITKTIRRGEALRKGDRRVLQFDHQEEVGHVWTPSGVAIRTGCVRVVLNKDNRLITAYPIGKM